MQDLNATFLDALITSRPLSDVLAYAAHMASADPVDDSEPPTGTHSTPTEVA